MKAFLIISGLMGVFLGALSVSYPNDHYDKWLTLLGAIVAFLELVRRTRDDEAEEIISTQAFEYQAALSINNSRRLSRNIIATLSVSLPFIVIGLSETIELSISCHYFTSSRDFLIGGLCALGVLLFTYPDRSSVQSAWCKALGLLCFVLAFFPAPCGPNALDAISLVHFFAKIAFFVTAAIYSSSVLEKANDSSAPSKQRRIIMYKICRYGILSSLSIWLVILMSIYIFRVDSLFVFQLIHYSEIALFVFFGLLWAARGDTNYKKVDNNAN